MKQLTYKKKHILWKTDDHTLIRAKPSWGYGNYILEVKTPFSALFCGLTLEEVTDKFREANSQYWKLAETKPAKVFGTKRNKKKK